MRRLLAILAVLAMVFTACTSNDDGSADTRPNDPETPEEVTTSDGGAGDSTPTSVAETDNPPGEDEGSTAPQDLDGPAPGVDADSIKIGVTYVDLEAVRDFVDPNSVCCSSSVSSSPNSPLRRTSPFRSCCRGSSALLRSPRP